MIRLRRRAIFPLVASLLVAGQTPALAAQPPDAFLALLFCYKTDPNLQFIKSQIPLAELVSFMPPGTWEGVRTGAGWIYRIRAEDQMSGEVTRIALRFDQLTEDAVGLTGSALNGQTQDVTNTFMLIRPVLVNVEMAKRPPPPMADPFASPEELLRRRGGFNPPSQPRGYGR